MIPAEDGGGSSAPSPSGPQTLKVDPPAIPKARDAFVAASQEIQDLVNELKATYTPAWAGDPVSQQTAERFDTGAGDRGTQPAIAALEKYGLELKGSGEALHQAYLAYVRNEGVNSQRWRGQDVEA